METSAKKSYKIIVIGESDVGKTCLSYRFCDGKYEARPSITIGMDLRCRKLDINGESITLQLWDTAGLEKNRHSMVTHYYRKADAVVIVYDVTCRRSFDNLQRWIDECREHALTDPIRVLVGNKCDMEPAVGRNEAQRFADANGMALFETSAKLDSEYNNIEAIFLTIAHKLVHQQPMAVTPDVVNLVSSENTGSSGTRWWTCWLF